MKSVEKDTKFVTLWNKKIHNLQQNLNIISLEHKLIIISNGSLTQNLNCITGNNINISFVKQNNTNNFYQYYNNKMIREVWIKDNYNNKLVFAQSFWTKMYTYLAQKEAIGKSLIEFEVDFYKEICNISYGYLWKIEKELRIKTPIWSRQCIIWHNKKPLTIIKEFFSPVFN